MTISALAPLVAVVSELHGAKVKEDIDAAPNLGLVCITTSRELRYRTITRKRLLGLSVKERRKVLLEIYRDNLSTLGGAPGYCRRLGTRLYRVPSGIFPFADEPIGIELLQRLDAPLAAVGRVVDALGVRLVMHPDQFVVLSSDSEAVVSNSVKLLSMHARILDALRQPASPWATIEIHGGKGGRSAALVAAIQTLPPNVRNRLALENDEKVYSAGAIAEICQSAGVPMVFDAHHHLCFERIGSYEHPSVAEMTALAAGTWPDAAWQLVHISNGREAIDDPRHSDEIAIMPSAFARVPWIEVEAKHKEIAIRRLQQEWRPPHDRPRRRNTAPRGRSARATTKR